MAALSPRRDDPRTRRAARSPTSRSTSQPSQAAHRAAELIDEALQRLQGRAARRRRRAAPGNCSRRSRRELRDELIGLGAIAEQMLADADAQEWMINGPRRIFRDTGERIERVTRSRFADDRQLRAFLERLLEKVEGKRLDRITPRVEARLPDGSRITAAIPPVSSNGHPICSIRRFRLGASSLAELEELGLPQRASRRVPDRLRPGRQEHRRRRPRLLRQDDAAERARQRDPRRRSASSSANRRPNSNCHAYSRTASATKPVRPASTGCRRSRSRTSSRMRCG